MSSFVPKMSCKTMEQRLSVLTDSFLSFVTSLMGSMTVTPRLTCITGTAGTLDRRWLRSASD